jgi:HAE1 family hydrophobic/amphiphilic exporter-1
MDLIRIAIDRPIAVISAVLMAVLFGALALSRIPIQLIPDVAKPVIEVETIWAGAAPAEIEREIVNRQEEQLRGLEGLDTMVSRSETGRARVNLEFAIGTNMDRALLLVSNRLDRVSGYPDEASAPTLDTSGSDDNPITWITLRRDPGNTREMSHYGDFANDVVKERIERVEGVALVNVFGGVERELQIIVEPENLAKYRLTIPDLVRALRTASISVSAGDVDEGKRRYVVRAEGELNTVEAVGAVVVRSGASQMRPEAGAGLQLQRAGRFPAIAINAVRETGANVIKTMQGIREAIEELRAGPLAEQRLNITQVYDETIYIDGAIDLVIQNIWIGGCWRR